MGREIRKTIYGFVEQIFDEDTGNCIHQEFFQNEDEEPIYDYIDGDWEVIAEANYKCPIDIKESE